MYEFNLAQTDIRHSKEQTDIQTFFGLCIIQAMKLKKNGYQKW